MTWPLTQGSARAKPGSWAETGSSHFTVFWPTAAATIVEAIGLETEASWKTVSGVTVSGRPSSRTPKPLAWTTLSL